MNKKHSLVFILAMLLLSNSLLYAQDSTTTEITNPVIQMSQYDISGILKELDELDKWFVDAIKNNMHNSKPIIHRYEERKEEIFKKVAEKRINEWSNEQLKLMVTKSVNAKRPTFGLRGFPPRTPGRNSASATVVCSLESSEWTPDGSGVISDIKKTGGGRGSERSIGDVVQTETGSQVTISVTSGHWDDYSTGHCGLGLTLTQKYSHNEDYIHEKVNADMSILRDIIAEARRLNDDIESTPDTDS